MLNESWAELVHRLRGLALQEECARLNDAELLECYLSARAEEAFAALVRRHGPMVLAVCRRVLNNAHDAEDAFQATFLVLARKAVSIQPRGHVGNWLYGVACRTAKKARSIAARRHARETALVEDMATTVPAPRDREIMAQLDLELNRMPSSYRDPLVLCHLRGLSRAEAARELGLAEGTLSSRLARGRDRLARRLAARGLSVTSLTPLLPPPSSDLPNSLVQAAVRAAISFATRSSACVVSPAVLALAQGVLRSMFTEKMKSFVVALLALGFIVGGATLSLRHPGGTALVAPSVQAEEKKDKPETGPTINGRVIAVDTKKNTITLQTQIDPGKKETTETTYSLAQDVKVLLEHGLLKENKPGKLDDLKKGAEVSATLSVDKKSVLTLSVRGGSIHGGVKAVDASKNTITVTVKSKEGAEEHSIELLKDAKIILDDGLGKKGDAPTEGKLSDLKEGITVNVQLSGYDSGKAVGVTASGPTLSGTLKGIDLGNRTITITMKGESGLEEKSYTLAKDARVDGAKLADLSAGTQVAVRLAVLDSKTVVGIRVQEK